MPMKPMFALHKDPAGSVLAANSFSHGFQMSDWLRNLDIRAGDTIEFQETAVRTEFDEVPEAPATPTSIEQPAPDADAKADEEINF